MTDHLTPTELAAHQHAHDVDVDRMIAQMAALDATSDALKTLRHTHEAAGRTAAHQRDVLRRIHGQLPTGPDKAVLGLLLEDVEHVVAAKAAYDRAYQASVAVRS